MLSDHKEWRGFAQHSGTNAPKAKGAARMRPTPAVRIRPTSRTDSPNTSRTDAPNQPGTNAPTTVARMRLKERHGFA